MELRRHAYVRTGNTTRTVHIRNRRHTMLLIGMFMLLFGYVDRHFSFYRQPIPCPDPITCLLMPFGAPERIASPHGLGKCLPAEGIEPTG